MLLPTEVILDVIILLSLFNSGYSIKCLQCWSFVDPSCEAGNIEATECEAKDAYCIKYVGKTKPRPMVFRDCNPVPVDKLCSIRIIEGHRIYVCYETCTTDGCNAGPAVNVASSHHCRGTGMVVVMVTIMTLWKVLMGQWV